MSEFVMTVFGSKDCKPCQGLKEDVEQLRHLIDIEFRYMDIDGDSKEVAETMSEEDRAVFEKLSKEYGADGVPMIHIKTDCGETTHRGYGSVERIIAMLDDVKCGRERSG